MPDLVVLHPRDIIHRGIREVVAVDALPFGGFQAGDKMLALHRMRIFVPTGKADEYASYDIDAHLFDQHFRTLDEAEPLVILVE